MRRGTASYCVGNSSQQFCTEGVGVHRQNVGFLLATPPTCVQICWGACSAVQGHRRVAWSTRGASRHADKEVPNKRSRFGTIAKRFASHRIKLLAQQVCCLLMTAQASAISEKLESRLHMWGKSLVESQATTMTPRARGWYVQGYCPPAWW